MSAAAVALLCGATSGSAAAQAGEYAMPPGPVGFYYGIPSLANGAAGDVQAAIEAFGRNDFVVLGGGLELPQYTGAEGQNPNYGCDQNSHTDHDKTAQIIQGMVGVEVFGYVSVGGENTATRCSSETPPAPLTVAEMKARIDAWAAMGASGIFMDEAEYGFGSTRQVQNEIVDYIHEKHLHAFLNGFNPDDVFGEVVLGQVTYSGGALAGQLSTVEMNPTGEPSHLTVGDMYLLEHFQVIGGTYRDPSAWAARAAATATYTQGKGILVSTLTTPALGAEGTSCEDTFNQAQFEYAFWSASLYGFFGVTWGEANGFSSWGPCANQVHWYLGPIVNETGNFLTDLPTTDSEGRFYRRETTRGVIVVDTVEHTGWFERTNSAPTAQTDLYSVLEGDTLAFAAADLLANDTDDDVDDVLSVVSVDATSARGGTIVADGTGGFVYTPPAGFAGGDDVLRYLVSDAVGAQDEGTIVVTVVDRIEAAVYAPITADTLTGYRVWGDKDSLRNSDRDELYIFARRPSLLSLLSLNFRYSTELESAFQVADASSTLSTLTVSFEGRYSRSVTQTVYLLNHDTGEWDVIDERGVSGNVNLALPVTQNPAPYLSESGEVRVRVMSATRSFLGYSSRVNLLSLSVE